MRPVGDAIEAAGVARAEQQIASADLVIFVADTTAPWDENLFRFVSQRPFLVVHNKCDLAPPPADGRPGGLQISAKTRAGIDMLCEGISQKLIPYPPPRGAGVPFTSAQVTALSELKTRLTRGDLSAAQQSSLFQIQ
jgi:tRNA modification GTPase